jgi:hypothetical protein
LLEAFVHADELVVLGDDLLGFAVVEDEVLDVVEQRSLGPSPRRKRSRLVPSWVICSRLIFSCSSSGRSQWKKCSQWAVRLPRRVSRPLERHAQGIGEEELRDVGLVVGEVVVVGRAQFDVGVLQFGEDQRQTVDVEQDVGAAVGGLGGGAGALDPELGDDEEVVVR